MQIIRLKDTRSTNEYLMDAAARWPQWEGAVTSDYQSAGKGMGENTWESETGKNLLFSILIHPTWLPVARQYLLSMAEAVAVCETLAEYTDGITIKWPNDIYWQDRKISGTRIDTNLCGAGIADMVIGTGININQRVFTGNAPNPVSLWQITGREHDRDAMLDKILAAFERYSAMLREGEEAEVISRYHACLYRRQGYHRYRDAGGEFEAKTMEVMPDGTLILQRRDGTRSEYMFKEIEFIL